MVGTGGNVPLGAPTGSIPLRRFVGHEPWLVGEWRDELDLGLQHFFAQVCGPFFQFGESKLDPLLQGRRETRSLSSSLGGAPI